MGNLYNYFSEMTPPIKNQASLCLRFSALSLLVYILTLSVCEVSTSPLYKLPDTEAYETQSATETFKEPNFRSFSAFKSNKRDEAVLQEQMQAIDELIKEKLMERLKSLYVVKTRSR